MIAALAEEGYELRTGLEKIVEVLRAGTQT